MVYTGLARQLNLSDDELAVVIGHEMSHALREHSREQISQAIAAQSAIGIGAALLGLGQGSADLAGMGYQAFVATRFSRTDEDEADRMGLELMARAGYDPRAAASQWSFPMFRCPGRARAMQLMSPRGPCYRESVSLRRRVEGHDRRQQGLDRLDAAFVRRMAAEERRGLRAVLRTDHLLPHRNGGARAGAD